MPLHASTVLAVVLVVGGGSPYYSSCGSAAGPASLPVAAGTYALSRVNSTVLPYLVSQSATEKDEILAGSASVTTNYTWSRTTTTRKTINGTVTTQTATDGGTFSFNGSMLFFHDSALATVAHGTQTHGALTIVSEDGLTVLGYIN